jgi:hypothetical protein
MNRRLTTALALLAVLVVVVAIHLHAGRPVRSPEQRIMLAIANAEEAAERGSVAGVMRIVSNDYADGAGNDRRALARLVLAAMRSRDRWHINTMLRSITVDQDSASTELSVTVSGETWEEMRGTYQIMAQWRREGRHWRVVHSDGWQHGTDTDGHDMPPYPAL